MDKLIQFILDDHYHMTTNNDNENKKVKNKFNSSV